MAREGSDSGDVVVSAIVVSYNSCELLGPCLDSLERALAAVDGRCELVVADNASTDGSAEHVRLQHPDADLVALADNRGFGGAVAAAVPRTRGAWVLLLNSDATIEEDAVATMLRAGASGGDVGAVAAQMRFVDGTVNSAGIVVDRLGIAYDRLVGATPKDAADPCEVFGASGGACLLRRSMLDDVGGFDETFFLYMEDADLAWRARMRGWRARYEPAAVVRHRHSATVGHGSDLKYFHVGLNRVRVLAKNATTGHLVRYGLAMAAYDIGYVLFVAVTQRTLAPLRGRLRGLREWRRYRAIGRDRVPVELAPVAGFRAALRRRAVWAGHTAGVRRSSVP